LLDRDPPAEELASGIVHGLGAALAAGGLAAMLQGTLEAGHDGWRAAAVGVFGLCMVVVYLSSTLLHMTRSDRARRVLLECDHIAIYLLIGGTYTPLTLHGVGGVWGWAVFVLVWGLSLAGIVLRLTLGEGHTVLYVTTYLAAGWAGVVAAGPMITALSPTGLIAIAAGGLFYTGGVGFFFWRRLPYNHAVWHGFALLGSACHFIAVWHEVVAAA
jgi:hemolysin III